MARTIQIPGYIHNLYHVVSTVRERVSSHLQDLVIRYLKQQKLVSTSLVGVQSMRVGTVTFRKALGRLVTIVEREAVKQAPYIKHLSIAAPDADIISCSSRGTNLYLSGVILCTEDSRLEAILIRYVRYVNYLLRKHSLPLSVECEGYNDLREDQMPSLSAELPLVIAKRVHLTLKVVGAYPVAYGTGARLRFDSLEEIKRRIASEGGNPDSVYSHRYLSTGVMWDLVAVSAYLTSEPSGPFVEDIPASLLTPELVYFHVQHIVKGIHSVSRKLSYVASAFSFESAE